MSFIDDCRKLIAIDSSPSTGTEAVADYLAKRCREIGLTVTTHDETLNGVPQKNVIARWGDADDRKEFMLLSHIDTVDPGPYGLWKKTEGNPFNASIYGQDLCGLGVQTGKLDILCKLEAIKRVLMEHSRFQKPFVLAATYGNHLGMAGAIKLIRRKMFHADMACIGEPTGLSVADGGSGFAKLEISIPFSEEEKKYHREHDLMESSSTQSKMFRGTTMEKGSLANNAIIKLLEYLEKLPSGIAIMDIDGGVAHNVQPQSAFIEIDMVDTFKDGVIKKLLLIRDEILKLTEEFKKHPDENFVTPYSTVNLGRIFKQNNHIHLLGSCRLLPSVSSATYEGWLESLGEACRHVGANFRILDYKRPFLTNKEAGILKTSLVVQKELFQKNQSTKVVRGTEASVFERTGQIDCIVFGAGQIPEDYSAADESISIADLEKSIEFYMRLIERVCL
ncbi:MAG: M20 family metallopeptidase [Bdellovibrionales bacterium]|nr:M20 family metallopeptidase [Bdellovibrionales bacterium]